MVFFSLQVSDVSKADRFSSQTAVGSDAEGFKVGDRVAIEAGVYCGKCRLCKTGRYNLCPKSE